MKQKNNFYSILLLVIFTFTSILLFNLYFSQEKNLKPKLVYGLEKGGSIGDYLLNFKNWTNDLLHFNNLRKQLVELKNENIDFVNQLQKFNEIKEENDLLKNALKIKEETNWSVESAKIILTDPSGLTGSFWINKGSEIGLKNGMNVILEDKVLVGRLIECFNSYCRGESIFSPETKISVEDLRSSTLAIAEKDMKGNFRLKLVPYESDIQIGDILVTSSENANFFKGLLVAKVKKSSSSSNISSLKEFILEPLLNFSQISYVLIITDIVPSL
jgi:rod shape-determining protein MreC